MPDHQAARTPSVSASDELVWVERARRGDQDAFARLVERYQVPVYHLAYRMLGNAAEAEDAAQETFVRAYTRLHTYRPEHKFSTWLLSIASHYCIDRLRRRRYVWLSADEEPIRQQLQQRTNSASPETAAMEAERRVEIQALLDQLDPMYRTPVILRYWYDLSYKEIAEVMEISEAAVKTRLHRARLQLADALQEDADTETLSHLPGQRASRG